MKNVQESINDNVAVTMAINNNDGDGDGGHVLNFNHHKHQQNNIIELLNSNPINNNDDDDKEPKSKEYSVAESEEIIHVSSKNSKNSGILRTKQESGLESTSGWPTTN
ncbi:hypothetical protein BLA29_004760 [Euroglyphus maynei]|uniref:Uncharacterized protein n=1 Tax=Euroglyphus maynei TaxID=6958 RepID=A0A1Y3ARS1_EURMA|nr:hypothetical protein BLA29_004760 [Euroglyphus maynei]